MQAHYFGYFCVIFNVLLHVISKECTSMDLTAWLSNVWIIKCFPVAQVIQCQTLKNYFVMYYIMYLLIAKMIWNRSSYLYLILSSNLILCMITDVEYDNSNKILFLFHKIFCYFSYEIHCWTFQFSAYWAYQKSLLVAPPVSHFGTKLTLCEVFWNHC